MPIDYKKYPPNWKTEIRPAVLKRAANKCEWCGFANGQIVYRCRIDKKMQWFPTMEDIYEQGLEKPLADFWAERPVKVVLTIAHLDHDELNHDVKLERLAALCQLCHLQYDAKEKYRRVMKNSNGSSK
jgi:hypothetical protein